MDASDYAKTMLAERAAFPVGSPDWDYRTRAAWKLDQMQRGIPACDWTEEHNNNGERYAA